LHYLATLRREASIGLALFILRRSTDVFVLQIELVGHILLLLTIPRLEFFFFLFDFLCSMCLKLREPCE